LALAPLKALLHIPLSQQALIKTCCSNQQGDSTEGQGKDLSSVLLEAVKASPPLKGKRKRSPPQLQHEIAQPSLDSGAETLDSEGAELPVPLREMEKELWGQGYRFVAGKSLQFPS